jgi:DNA-directed RNA polymerase subunit RPC12/RpoP
VIVRCGRCRSELEISGPGEFVCPACGTRNVARGGAVQDPFSIGGPVADRSGLTVPGGGPMPPAPSGPPIEIRWGRCPACSHRFAMGEADQITCPNCRASLELAADGSLTETRS